MEPEQRTKLMLVSVFICMMVASGLVGVGIYRVLNPPVYPDHSVPIRITTLGAVLNYPNYSFIYEYYLNDTPTRVTNATYFMLSMHFEAVPVENNTIAVQFRYQEAWWQGLEYRLHAFGLGSPSSPVWEIADEGDWSMYVSYGGRAALYLMGYFFGPVSGFYDGVAGCPSVWVVAYPQEVGE